MNKFKGMTDAMDEVDGLRTAIKQRITKLPPEPLELTALTAIIMRFFEETAAKGLELSAIIEDDSIIMVQVMGKDQNQRWIHEYTN